MPDPRLVVAVENAAFAAWPAAEEKEEDGWIHRYGDGFSRRVNSVTIMPAAASDALAGRTARAGAWLRHRGADALVRVLSVAPPAVDGWLEARGYGREGETVVMIGDLPGDGDARLADLPDAEWLDAQQAWSGIDPDAREGWLHMLARISQPAAFASRRHDDGLCTVGIGVVRGRWLVLFEVATAPRHRRRGHARSLVGALGHWASAHGSDAALLQVVADNVAARRLYSGLGFTEAYRYWYRRPPPGEETLPGSVEAAGPGYRSPRRWCDPFARAGSPPSV